MKNRPGTMKNRPGTMKNHENQAGTMKKQPGTMKNHENGSFHPQNKQTMIDITAPGWQTQFGFHLLYKSQN